MLTISSIVQVQRQTRRNENNHDVFYAGAATGYLVVDVMKRMKEQIMIRPTEASARTIHIMNMPVECSEDSSERIKVLKPSMTKYK